MLLICVHSFAFPMFILFMLLSPIALIKTASMSSMTVFGATFYVSATSLSLLKPLLSFPAKSLLKPNQLKRFHVSPCKSDRCCFRRSPKDRSFTSPT